MKGDLSLRRVDGEVWKSVSKVERHGCKRARRNVDSFLWKFRAARQRSRELFIANDHQIDHV